MCTFSYHVDFVLSLVKVKTYSTCSCIQNHLTTQMKTYERFVLRTHKNFGLFLFFFVMMKSMHCAISIPSFHLKFNGLNKYLSGEFHFNSFFYLNFAGDIICQATFLCVISMPSAIDIRDELIYCKIYAIQNLSHKFKLPRKAIVFCFSFRKTTFHCIDKPF